jgi:hypothetical protein
MISFSEITAEWLAENIDNEVLLKAIELQIDKKEVSSDSITVEDISYFTESSKGKGRDSNDARNAKREKILIDLFNNKLGAYLDDPKYGASWKALDSSFREAVLKIVERNCGSSTGDIRLQRKAGRKNHNDFSIVVNRTIKIPLEFKYGADVIDGLPEYLNASGKEPFHSDLYASFFYKNYVPRIHTLYGIKQPLLTEDEYVKGVHTDKPSHKWLKALVVADRTDTPNRKDKKGHGPLKKQLDVLVKDSIEQYLDAVKDSICLEKITEKLSSTQNNKHFLLYKNGKFLHDRFDPAEFVAARIAGIKNKNTLLIESSKSSTVHHFLLRWKNHNGIMYPAWQVSLERKS